jgi:transcriptional regulator with PAS, ATPase and Fis domain
VLDPGDPLSAAAGGYMTMREYEMKILKATLRKYNNDIGLTAKQLDIGISTIYRLLKENKESVK